MFLGGTVRSVEDAGLLKAMGLDFGEISISDVRRFQEALPDYKREIRGADFFFLCHGPQEGDPNDIHSLENMYLPKLVETIPLVYELGSSLLTIHLWMDRRFVSQEAIVYKVGLLRRLLDLADTYRVKLNIENLSEGLEDFLPVFETLPNLGLTLDVGHGQLLAETNTSFDFLRGMPERIRHVHIHDNVGGSSHKDDLHLPVGSGSIDFKAIFRAIASIGYRGTFTIELVPEKIKLCLDKVRELLKSTGIDREN